MEKYKELGKILFSDQPIEKSIKFGKITPTCPPFESRLVFMSEEKRKEWDEVDEQTKSLVMQNLHKTTEYMEVRIAIELLCHCINDVSDRLKSLEGK